MFSFESFLDLPLIWGVIIATAVFLYVFLDGFDLGVGIMFPFAPSEKCRDKMMNSIAPFWDGNETWLVLGGGGLFAAFPLAYAIIMPAFYLPVILMLLGLIFRGVAFEFRFKAKKSKKLWDFAFHYGSLLAAFMQGMILGSFVEGIKVEGRSFAGGPFDWISGFSFLTGLALVFGYILLGSTWLIMKTDSTTQNWARRTACYSLGFVGLAMVIVTISMPVMNPEIYEFWFTAPTVYYLLPIPLITIYAFIQIWRSALGNGEYKPFIYSMLIFLLSYVGLAISFYPMIVPFEVDIWKAAAAPESLSIMLIGVGIMLPTILVYTGYCYYIFRGKTSEESAY